MTPRLSHLAQNLNTETAFSVLAEARALKAKGKDVVELEIGDSPFPSTNHAKLAGIEAIARNITGYCPSLGIPELREAAAAMMCPDLQPTLSHLHAEPRSPRCQVRFRSPEA